MFGLAFELLGGIGIVLVLVRMPLQCALAVGFLNLILSCIGLDACAVCQYLRGTETAMYR